MEGEYCIFEKKRVSDPDIKAIRIAHIIICIIISVVSSKLTFDMVKDSIVDNSVFSILMLVPAFFGIVGIGSIIYAFLEALDMTAKVGITEHGIIIKYPLCPWAAISWEQFQVACICFEYKRHTEGDSMLCLVKYGERTSIRGRWKTENPLHYRRLIRMYYTEELLSGLLQYYPNPIYDLRKTPPYRHN